MKQNEQQRAFAAAHLQSFKDKYFFPTQLELLEFDEDLGNFVIRDDLKPEFEQDAREAYHQVNTGWTMYKKGVSTGLELNSWVSVDERLPVHDGIYLTYSPSSHGRKITTREMINGKWSGVLNITHWQPIQPPKGVE